MKESFENDLQWWIHPVLSVVVNDLGEHQVEGAIDGQVKPLRLFADVFAHV